MYYNTYHTRQGGGLNATRGAVGHPTQRQIATPKGAIRPAFPTVELSGPSPSRVSQPLGAAKASSSLFTPSSPIMRQGGGLSTTWRSVGHPTQRQAATPKGAIRSAFSTIELSSLSLVGSLAHPDPRSLPSFHFSSSPSAARRKPERDLAFGWAPDLAKPATPIGDNSTGSHNCRIERAEPSSGQPNASEQRGFSTCIHSTFTRFC